MAADPKTFTQEQVDQIIAEKTKGALTQDRVDAIVEERLARQKSKYSDYEDLQKFKSQHEKELEQATQKELEAKKEYEKLKEGWTKKEQEMSGVITKKDAEIIDMKIGNALMSELTQQNAYLEESMALLKSQAVFDKDNNLRIKGKTADGLDTLHSVTEGVKQFLTVRPHLVKASKLGGGGTPPGGAGGGAGGVLSEVVRRKRRRGSDQHC